MENGREGRHVCALYLVKVEGVQVVLRQIRDGVLVSGAPYPYNHSVTNVQSKYDHAMVSTLVISQLR